MRFYVPDGSFMGRYDASDWLNRWNERMKIVLFPKKGKKKKKEKQADLGVQDLALTRAE